MKTEKQFLQEGIDTLQVAVDNMPMSEYQDEVEAILDSMKSKLKEL
tara:strand:+ start:334 stop:471 length:138 start_codon:yes stop_codon:yes gene_type:complete